MDKISVVDIGGEIAVVQKCKEVRYPGTKEFMRIFNNRMTKGNSRIKLNPEKIAEDLGYRNKASGRCILSSYKHGRLRLSDIRQVYVLCILSGMNLQDAEEILRSDLWEDV